MPTLDFVVKHATAYPSGSVDFQIALLTPAGAVVMNGHLTVSPVLFCIDAITSCEADAFLFCAALVMGRNESIMREVRAFADRDGRQ